MAAGYVIQIGNEKPGEAIVAQPNKRGEPSGDQFRTYIRVGTHLIMNRARVWGRRVMVDKKKQDNGMPIETNTIGYAGELEFLDWEKEGGYAIDIRYIKESRSLDFEYQENVQKIKIDSEKGAAFIEARAGENKYDYKKDGLLIKFLKVTPQNRDSKSKNPNPEIKGYSFYEVTDEHVDSVSIKERETNIEAGYLVKSLSSKPKLIRNLFEILGNRPEFGDTNKLSGDRQIYKVLLEFSETNPSDFFFIINEYKKEVQDYFDKATSYKVLDLTKDGHIALNIDNKKELLISGLKAKGDGMVEYMIENYYEDEVYNATQILKQLVQKLK